MNLKRTPVRVGERYRLNIEKVGSSGDGIGRIEGFAIFVPYTVPGDVTLIEVEELKKNYARGRLIEILRSSPDRLDDDCPVFHQCGGCQLRHVRYEAQLTLKTQLVKGTLEHIGKLKGITVHPAIGMKDPQYYRNKAQFPVRLRDGRVEMGFFAPGTHEVVDIEECRIQHPLINRIFRAIKGLLNDMKPSIYDEVSHTGLLRHVAIRVTQRGEEAMVIFVTSSREFEAGIRLADELMERFPQVVSVVQNINPARTNVIFGEETLIIKGKDFIEEEIGGLRFRISPLSFFQVNTIQMEVLYSKALEYADLRGSETVIDAYCGIGTISLFLARRCEIVYGIEEVSEAIVKARDNARLNDIRNVLFFVGKVETVIPRLHLEGVKPEVVVIDPPRKGCEREVLEIFTAMGPQRIVYVSCNPATLARDLAYLQELNYIAEEVQPVDMFPATAHVECVTLMSRVEK